MTAAKDKDIRADRARGEEPTNQEKREAAEAARRAEEDRPTIERLWVLYDEAQSERRSRDTDSARYQLHRSKPFACKTPAELVTLDIDRRRIRKLKTLSPRS